MPLNPCFRDNHLKGHFALSLVLCILFLAWSLPIHAQSSALRDQYLAQVVPRLEPPPDEVERYGQLAVESLETAGVDRRAPQYVVVVDRNPRVQAVLVLWVPLSASVELIGASPVSTGRIGQFDHFETPLGVFSHTTANPDFRAEGTKNKLGFRGYGVKGMRVYDLGWQQATRGWGKGGKSTIRLQMHSTDPDLAEAKLGSVQSKGCIRIPASLNQLIDASGLLDAAYEETNAAGPPLWILKADRLSVAGAGRYLVIVDTLRSEKPAWSVAAQSLPPVLLGPLRTR